jgi:2-keto-4-pentenoate hydratase/2-oxohepta-3-ene-1,7-dioic acid hydratase in catechol pathway
VTSKEIDDPYKLKGKRCEHKLGGFLEHGDTIELDVEKIGVLKNKVERQAA